MFTALPFALLQEIIKEMNTIPILLTLGGWPV